MSATIQDLISEYRYHAFQHGVADEGVGNPRLGNRHANHVARLRRELLARGVEGRSAILDLMQDPSPAVRGWASAHALEIDEARARPVLEALALEPGIHGFSAGIVLEEWAKGTLRFP